MGNSRTGRRAVEARDREARVLAMRRGGASFEQIAKAVGISRVSAYRITRRVLDRTLRTTAETAEELKRLELERLDALQAAIWPRAMKADAQAVTAAVRISESRRRLLGLDAPLRQQIETPRVWDLEKLLFKRPPAVPTDNGAAGDEDEPAHNGWTFDPAADVAEMRRKGELPPA